MPIQFRRRTHPYITRITLLIFSCMTSVMTIAVSCFGQCTTSGPQAIPDDGILTIDFAVTGLIDSDLASATQGICGVEIDFMHEYVGDLTISLISPSGTVVQLTGPPTGAIMPTNLSRWNIDFIPCMMPAMPDGSFQATWSNNQMWQIATNYGGSYHPSSGCLEDFNSGSANGVWRIIFEDHDILQTGSVASVTLIFCNPAGLQCNECLPNAGVLSPPALVFCENQRIQTSDITVDFQANPPSPLYSFTFLLSQDNTILTSGPAFLYDADPGSFTICGLSFLNTDATAVNALIASGDLTMVSQAISNGTICAEISNPCVVVTVTPEPDTVVHDFVLCTGESIVFRGQLFSNPGIFYVVEEEINACDSVFRLNIAASDLIADILTPDSVSCGGSGVVLDGSLSQGDPILYEWSTSAGIINGNINQSQVVALVPGAYTLTVRDGVCEDAKDVIVFGDQSYPQIFMTGDIITCANPVVTIHPVVSPSNVTYSWTGPGGFSSAMRDIDVSVPGRYFLRVVAPNGCESFTYIDIIADVESPDANIQIFDKDCKNSFGVVGVAEPGNIYEWSGPGSSNYPTNQIIGVSLTGLYTITVTDPVNGCVSTGSFDYIAEYEIPDMEILGLDSLRCNAPVNIMIPDDGFNSPPVWYGPNGYIAVGYDVSLTQPGMYTVYVTGLNGCRNSTIVDVIPASGYPSYTITNDTISCIDNVATIGITMPGADIFFWPAIPPPDNENAFVQLMTSGTFFINALDTTSGCLVEATATIVANTAPPPFEFETDTITCSDSNAELQFIPSAGQEYTSVEWHLPDMTVVANQTLLVNEIGDYLLSVTGKNGCVGSSLLTVIADTVKPLFFLEPDVIGCDFMGVIHNIRVDSLAGILWAGPNGFTSAELDPMITDTGFYTASGFAANGCERIVSTHVAGDFIPPPTTFTLDSLDCLSPFAELIVHSVDEIISYQWTDPSGNTISNDSIAMPADPGRYIVTVEGDNHCFQSDTIDLLSPDYPIISLSSDTFSCEIGMAEIVAVSDILNTQFNWLDLSGDTLGKSDVVIVDNPGPFIISAIGPNGCETKDTITIPVDTLTPVAVINLIGEIRCQNRDFMLDGSLSTPSHVQFIWNTTGGNILSDNTQPLINAMDTGRYLLMITNPVNGCTDTASIRMGEHPDAITLAHLSVKPPRCSGEANAEITVTDLVGGVQPVLYSLDSSLQQSSGSFQGLQSGTYLLEITDNAGCIYDTIITIDPTNPFTVNAGFDQEIFIGETASLFGETDILPDEIFSQEWDSSGVVFCQDCIESAVRPFSTTTYRFNVTSVTGCVKQDEVIIYVVEKAKFFIPNIFSPNGDNSNEELIFSTGPGIVRVHRWLIFDRWGDMVFEKLSFDPADPSVYWDGTASQGSENLNPGVFTYILDVELLTGKREIYYGSITLVR